VVEEDARTWVRYVRTMKETIHVYPAEEEPSEPITRSASGGELFFDFTIGWCVNEGKQPVTSGSPLQLR
jgi:hypothetical protein